MRAEWLLLGLASGCTAVCKGPGCAETYSAARLSVLAGRTPLDGTLDPWTQAETRIDGTEAEGTDWRVATGAGPGMAWVGLPDADTAVRVSLVAGATTLDPIASVVGDGALGSALATGDFDGDGLRDLVVGAPDHDLESGVVYLFRGLATAEQRDVDVSRADVAIHGESPADHLGAEVVACADVTGDGLPELAIGIPQLAAADGLTVPELAGGVLMVPSETLAGASGDYTPLELGMIWHGQDVGDGAGTAIDCGHDLSGDRIADVVIGAPRAEGGEGRVYVIARDPNAKHNDVLPASGPIADAARTVLASSEPSAWFGSAVLAADLNRATPADLAIGAAGAHLGEGRVEIFDGATLFAGSPQPAHVIRDQGTRDEPDHLGRWLVAGDMDGDTRDDLVLGVPDWKSGANGYDSGQAFVWSGGASEAWPAAFTVDSSDWTIVGSDAFARVGRAPRVADIDGDGLGDLILPTRTTPPEP